ncbi:hypothetical protein FACS189419_01260 [Planctomycetales bacterium]|nr:hypothetical protein FACS189419_01260 [Planctomycetales bacterium]
MFPDLEIIEVIGRGGMGTVYKARQPKLDRFVALKILSENLAAKPVFAERFAREGKILAKLNHPNIVSVYDFGQVNAGDTSLFYLILEYVDGVNLRQAMREEKFTPEQAIAIVPKICEALQFAHDEGVLHRDIKPENILLDAKGRVKIADFGIASIRNEHPGVARSTATPPALGNETHLTAPGQILGTPDYMAPEQHDSPETVDHRADIFSLGVVFYELLTGELPRGSFPPPSANTPVSTKIDGIVLKALKKNREQRQQTAFELKTEIETVTITQKENETMSPNEEHFEQPQQAANEQQPPPKWNEVGIVEKSGSGDNIWKILFLILFSTVLAFVGLSTLIRMGMTDRLSQSGGGGLLIMLALIIGGVVLIVYLLTKNNRTALPTVSPVYLTTDNRGSGGSVWKSLLWFLGGVFIVLFGVIVLRNVSDVAARNPPLLAFGTGIIPLIIVGGLVLLVYLIVKNVGTSVTNIPHVDQSTLFCTHCGGRLAGGVYACPHCGFAPRSERNFCFHCGVATNPKQVMCIACGFPLQMPLSSQVSGLLKAKKDKVAAGILAILLGWLGFHKFYLGSWGWGIVYILFSLTGITFILGIIEGVIYLVMDEVAFDVKYNQTLASPFRW